MFSRHCICTSQLHKHMYIHIKTHTHTHTHTHTLTLSHKHTHTNTPCYTHTHTHTHTHLKEDIEDTLVAVCQHFLYHFSLTVQFCVTFVNLTQNFRGAAS